MRMKRFRGEGWALLGMIWALAWPTMLEQLMSTAVQYVDAAMVGRLGAQATAAVGATTTVSWLIGSTVSALGIGFLSFIAQAYGGSALLLTHRVQLEQYGERGYLQVQKMNGHCARDMGYDGCLSEEGQLLSCENCAYRPRGAKWVRFEQNPAWSPE